MMLDINGLRRQTSNKREGSIASILDEIKVNELTLPEFQRDYVWKITDVQALLTSIIAGRIIGGLLAWETTKPIKSLSMTGTKDISPDTDKFAYLLDGQQRMTSLYHAFKGDTYRRIDFSKILVNLDAELIEDLIVVETKVETYDRAIPFCDIFSEEGLAKHGNIISVNEKFSLQMLGNRIQDYSISIFTLRTDDIGEAIDQFNALNTKGKKMSTHEIILSKIYSPDFKLKEEVAKLIAETKSFKLTEKVILDSLAFCVNESSKSSDMILMEYDEVKENWKAFSKAVKTTTDYLTRCGFHNLKTLPYKNNFIAVCRLLFEKNLTHLDTIQHGNVLRYILYTGIVKRYNASSYSSMYQDYSKLKTILNTNSHQEFQVENVTNRFVQLNGHNKTGDVFRKAILWMLENEMPLSMKNNMAIKIDQHSNSKRYCLNLHHIFPKNYLKDKNSMYPADHLANLCHVESGINQKEISDKKPSVYLAELAQQNPKIKEACHSLQFDYDIAVQDNYDKFFEDRLDKIRKLIESHFPELTA